VWLVADDRSGRRRTITIVAATLVVLSLPYLASVAPYMHDIVFYDSAKGPQGSSAWVLLNHVVSADAARWISLLGFAVFAAGAVWLARRVGRRRFDLAIALTLLLFVSCSKVVLEQYLLWPMPWLLVVAAGGSGVMRRAALLTVAVLTVLGLLNCEGYHPYGRSVAAFGVAIVAVTAGWFVLVIRSRAAADSLETITQVRTAPR
jgi:hypothetical protein